MCGSDPLLNVEISAVIFSNLIPRPVLRKLRQIWVFLICKFAPRAFLLTGRLDHALPGPSKKSFVCYSHSPDLCLFRLRLNLHRMQLRQVWVFLIRKLAPRAFLLTPRICAFLLEFQLVQNATGACLRSWALRPHLSKFCSQRIAD